MKFPNCMIISVLFTGAVIGFVPVAANAQAFNGPSVGIEAGWQNTDVRNPTTAAGVVPLDTSKDAAVAGVNLGYDKTFGHYVVGAETNLDFTIKGAVHNTGPGFDTRIDPRRSFDVSVRAGYLVTPQTLVYARGGYTNDRIRTTLASADTATVVSQDRGGWLVGAGVERFIMPHLSARIEYRYADLSHGDGKYDRHQVLTGLNWHF